MLVYEFGLQRETLCFRSIASTQRFVKKQFRLTKRTIFELSFLPMGNRLSNCHLQHIECFSSPEASPCFDRVQPHATEFCRLKRQGNMRSLSRNSFGWTISELKKEFYNSYRKVLLQPTLLKASKYQCLLQKLDGGKQQKPKRPR